MRGVSVEAVRHKTFLRLHYRAEVRPMSVSARRKAAREAARRVANLPEFQRAKVVGVFLSLPSEIDTAPLIDMTQKQNKICAVPVVHPESGAMRFALWPVGGNKGSRFVENVYGILEPAHPEWIDALDFLLVPGAAFTPDGHRLGAGAGYYDRYLARRKSLFSVGYCFNQQMAPRLPIQTHDQKVNAIATPGKLYRHGKLFSHFNSRRITQTEPESGSAHLGTSPVGSPLRLRRRGPPPLGSLRRTQARSASFG